MGNIIENKFQKEAYPNALQGLDFNGINQYIEVENDPFIFSDSFSINCFLKPKQGGELEIVLGKDDGIGGIPGTNRGYSLYSYNITTIPFVYFTVFDDDNINNLITTGIVTYSEYRYNRWHMITTVFNSGNNIQLYINGKLVKTVTTTITRHRQSTVTANFNIGGYRESYNYSGQIAHVSLYSKALNEGEIRYLHRYVGLIPESAHGNCVGYYDLQQRDDINSTTLPVLKDDRVAHWTLDKVEVASSTLFNQVEKIYDKVGGFDLSFNELDTTTRGRYRENDGSVVYYLANSDGGTPITSRLINLDISLTNPFSIIIVYRERQAYTTSVTKISSLNSSTEFSWNYSSTDGNSNIITAGGSSMVIDKVAIDGLFHIVQIDINFLNSAFYIDNVKSDNNSGTGIGSINGLSLHTSGGQFAFSEMIILKVIPTTVERTTIYNYLVNKYGL